MAYSIDKRSRSWAKSLTWRLLGIIILGGLSWLFTKNLAEMTLITLTFNAIRFVLYYFHERWWDRVKWGRHEAKEDYMI